MIYSDNAINILAATTYKNIGNAWIIKNLKDRKSIDAIAFLLSKDAKENYCVTREDFENKRQQIINEIEKLKEFADGVVAIGDSAFPPCRGNAKNSEQPVVIFYRGNIRLLMAENRNVAVIGLLNPDNDIKAIEEETVAELVKNDVTIISGLALGCDSIAHRQAMRSNGKTVAILPSPLNNILPASNIELADRIVKNNGLLITEYYKDAKSSMELRGRYQQRDRLQALFSDGVVLSASYAKNDQGNDSGSRLAMEYALKYSIPRAVIYNRVTDVDNPKYELNRQLIKEHKDITIIEKNNLRLSVEKIIFNRPDAVNNWQVNKAGYNRRQLSLNFGDVY
ncbi:MAG: DNA-protecting protein DprA [Helicobacteraceae bacterium]|jgi:DNA processing protein|nr:DNA-protecting protein DprA [Helicobacteraceae bacterium]